MPAIGKQTLVEQVAPVQRKAGADAPSDGSVHEAAARGAATPSSPLPHGDQIQRAFGRHDISGIQAHTGSAATASANDMGAQAYASGNHVVLGDRGGDLHTVAHEAAHVVQQRGGVQLKGGVGAEGDTYEQHADAVADKVVAGQSAEGLLDAHAGGGHAPSAGAPVQRKLSIGPKKEEATPLQTVADASARWAEIKDAAPLKDIQEAAHQMLIEWVTRPAASKNPKDVSENRLYKDNNELVAALAGDVKSQGAVAHENKLAAETMSSEQINAGLGAILTKLKAFHTQHELDQAASGAKARYAGWTYGKQGDSIAVGLGALPADLPGRAAFIADYALAMRKHVAAAANFDWSGTMNQGMTPELNAARSTHHNVDEASPWVLEARKNNLALSAGPSATTAQSMTLATVLAASVEEKTALAWGLFAIWNVMPLHASGTHRFHEVMVVAAAYGVPYEPNKYPEAKS